MPTLEAAFIAALTADAEVSALAGGRVFTWGGRQGAEYPYVTIQRISTPGASHLDGPATLEWPRFQVDVWAETGLAALNLAEAIRAAVDHRTIAGNPEFTATFQDQRGPAPDEQTRNFGVSQDFLVFHERS